MSLPQLETQPYVQLLLQYVFSYVVIVVVVCIQQIGGNLITNFFTCRLTSTSADGEVTFVSSTV